MSAGLYIQISSDSKIRQENIVFYEADAWNIDSEKQLLVRIQDLLSVARAYSKSFEVIINLEVLDLDSALFYINRKKNHQYNIKNQKLSIREIEVLGLIMQGFTNNEIADKLFISFETVRSHRKNILHKTGAKNTAALINYYHQTFFEK